MQNKYDIIVVGAGSGGLNIASFMNKVGFSVLLIDKSDINIGGDCLNYGCVPSKALIHISRLIYDAKKSKRFGMKIKGKINIKKVTEYIKEKQDVIRKHENADYFREKGMDVVLGEAEFAGKNYVKVNNKVFSGEKIVLATGGKPRKLKIEGIDRLEYGKTYFDNESVFDLNELPKKFLFIGGGPIGIELGQTLKRLGSEVTIVQRGSQFLNKERKNISDLLLKQLKKEGIKFYFNCEPVKITGGNKALLKGKKGNKYEEEFDAIFVGIGRELNIPKGLKKAGIELGENGKLIVDDYLRTTNKKIYVVGDIVGSYQFTHAAELHSRIVLNNFFSPFKKKINYDKLSWVTYTYPEIANFGLNEKQLKKRNIDYEMLELGLESDRHIVENFTEGKLILFIQKNKILGGSMIAPDAGELSQELILAMSSELNIKELFNKTYPYPTAARINKKIITNYFAKKLTVFREKILRFLYNKV